MQDKEQLSFKVVSIPEVDDDKLLVKIEAQES